MVAKAGNGASANDAKGEGKHSAPPPARNGMLVFWIFVLCTTQLAMFIFTKRASQSASLPLFICLAQFAISVVCAAAASIFGGRVELMGAEHWSLLGPLSFVWTMGFILLTASIAAMSAALAGVVRSMEPVASVLLGLALGNRYPAKVYAALIPVCGGVVLASKGGGAVTVAGVALALLSNFGFCARPYLTQRLKEHHGRQLNQNSVFFNVMLLGTGMLLCAVILIERGAIATAYEDLGSKDGGAGLQGFLLDTFRSGVSFFFYQLAQFKVMSQLNPLTFSVLTPVSKALMIVVCALYFGDPFGVSNASGIAITTVGVLLFAAAKRSGNAAAAAASSKKAS